MLAALVLTDGDQHIGEEERTPHDQEEKKTQRPRLWRLVAHCSKLESCLVCLGLVDLVGLFYCLSRLVFLILNRRMLEWLLLSCGKDALCLWRSRSVRLIAHHHDDQRNEEGHDEPTEDETRLVQGTGCRAQTPSACPGNPLLEWAVTTLQETRRTSSESMFFNHRIPRFK